MSENGSSDRSSSPPTEIPKAVLGLDIVYEVLSHPRRRYLCYTLTESAEWSLSELAVKLAAWEQGVPENAVEASQRDRMYASLYHAHVPKLVDKEVVTFDSKNETLEVGPNAEDVLTALAGLSTVLDQDQRTHARSETEDDRT